MTWKTLRRKFKVRSWRIIKGFENYRVTNDGRVYTVRAGKFINQHYNLDSYKRVELYNGDGVRHWFFVHRLVALHYKKNPDPKTKLEVNHLDWNKHNNNAKNLQWCSSSENKLHNRLRWISRKRKKVDWEKEFAKVPPPEPCAQPQVTTIILPMIEPSPIHYGDDPPF